MNNSTGEWGDTRQNAIANARLFLQAAKTEIDRTFGAGHAEENSVLVSCFMDICARHCEDSTTVRIMEREQEHYERMRAEEEY